MTQTSRRKFLGSLSRGLGSLALVPYLDNMRALASGDPGRQPKRFVFIARSNGLLPYGIQPVGLEDEVNGFSNRIVRSKEMTERSLADLRLHPTMESLEPFRPKLNIVQGLSAQMCSGNHSAHYGALGVYPMREGGPKTETIDSKLARSFPSIFPHLGLMLADLGRKVLDPRLSASGPGKPISYYADPSLAYQDVFGSVAKGASGMSARSELDRNLLDFLVRDIKRTQARVPASEREHLGDYLAGFEALQTRRARIAALGDDIVARAPVSNEKYTSEKETERLEAHFELAAASLITGLTNVLSISLDKLETRYTGLGLGQHTVHHLGHLEVKGNTGNDPEDWEGKDGVVEGRVARDKIRKFHFDLIAGLATKLEAVPEGDGTMLDNTLIVFFAESGDRHHPSFLTWPVVTLGSLGGSLQTGKYLRIPTHGERDHATLGNFYTTILHGAGMPQDGFGVKDVRLGPEIDQDSPIQPLLS